MRYSYECPLCRNTLSDYELTLLGIKHGNKKSKEINEEMLNELLLVLYIIDTLFEQDEDI